MGCTTSKLDDLPAVALCRDRCKFLETAIQQSSALADAHVAYMQSLKRLGLSLQRFLDQPDGQFTSNSNGDPAPAIPSSSPPATAPDHSHSNSDSQRQLHSDSESLHHSTGSSPPSYQINCGFHNHQALTEIMSLNYSKNQSMRSVAYSYLNYDSPSYQYHDYSTRNKGFGGFFGSSPSPPQPFAGISSSKTPSPPPAPSSGLAWDFLNLFETYERYEPPFNPNRGSNDAREDDVIANSEGKGCEREIDKEISENEDSRRDNDEDINESVPSVLVGKDAERVPEFEVQVLESNVVPDKEGSKQRSHIGTRHVYDVVREMQVLFEKASETGNEVSKIIEAVKFHYPQNSSVSRDSSKLLHKISPSMSIVSSQPSTSKITETSPSAEKIGSVKLGLDEAMGMSSGNLSSTMKKLYLWEKKLYDEVKGEEKLQIIHDRKCRQLKCMDEKGAEARKIESTRVLVINLSTKIKIAVQVVEKISITINKLRDEELWLFIDEFIHGLMRMWEAMLECHRSLSQLVSGAEGLGHITSIGKLSDAYVEAIMQLRLELQNCNLSFSNWVDFQKGYVKALSGWLLRCLFHEPEETTDGLAPFSPSSIGAPPVFVICNLWSHAIERLSGKEVTEAIQIFINSLNQLLEQHNLDLQQRMIADKDMERKLRTLEREEQKMLKVMHARDKKLFHAGGARNGVQFSGSEVYKSEIMNINGFHSGLKNIFEAMERFADKSMQAYDKLRPYIREARHDLDNVKVV